MGSCRQDMPLTSVDADHRVACRHAAGVLLRKGHQSFALVLPTGPHGGDIDSELEFREAIQSARGGQLRTLWHDGSARHICSLMDEALRSAHPPTAFLVARGAHVITVMMYLLRRGKRIPQDAAVISRDNDSFLQSTTPEVARYAINTAQFARRVSLAMRQLVESGPLEPKAIRLMPTFLPGETV
jgi:DNA-binding LacI/PurR family transcriptional regulator